MPPRAVSDDGGGEDPGNAAGVAGRANGTGYRVGVPPKKSVLEEFSGAAKELFFSDDDPLLRYREQPSWGRRAWLGLQYVFPVLDWGRHYTLAKFKGDLIAGLTIASLCIPQVLTVHCLYSPVQ
jgi:high affinity sulfate transporter 1